MKTPIKLIAVLLLASFFFACGNNSEEDGYDFSKNPEAYSYRPTTIYNDGSTIVSVKGRNFGTDLSKVKIIIDGKDITASSVTDTEIRFTFPAVELKEFERERSILMDVHVTKGDISNQRNYLAFNKSIPITYKEPKGWFFVSNLTVNSINDGATSFGICDDGTLWAFGFQHCQRSYDGGLSWKNAIAGNSKRNGYMISKDIGWANNFRTGHINIMRGGANFAHTEFKSIPIIDTTSAYYVSGMWMDGVESGILAYKEGYIFATDVLRDGKVYLMYQNIDKEIIYMSATGKYDFTAYAREYKNKSKKYLIHKNDGDAPVEYEIGAYAKQDITKLQRLKSGTVYFINSEYDLHKVTWPFTVTKLNQKAYEVYFVNDSIAYLVYEGVVYKTVDGAQTWNAEYTIADYNRTIPRGICVKDGKVWVLLADRAQNGRAYILKYNP